MPMWTMAELEEADSYEPVGGATIQEVASIYGPNARCLYFSILHWDCRHLHFLT